jgi:hypothetical protein
MNMRRGIEVRKRGTCARRVGFFFSYQRSHSTCRADRDGSITCEANEMPCEFVSPILHWIEGVESLCRLTEWMNAIGAVVDGSCGVHITVGIESVIGSKESGKVSEFVRKLVHIAQWHAMSLYGQTGTGRHLNRYSHTLAADVERHMRKIVNTSSVADKEAAAAACGRGMLNFQNVPPLSWLCVSG